jgi:hypothetical protein
MDVIYEKLKKRLKDLMNDEEVQKLQITRPSLYKKIVTDIGHSNKDISMMNKEIKKITK